MTDIHSCSYYCDRPECIKAQRDELVQEFIETNAMSEAYRQGYNDGYAEAQESHEA